MHRRGGAGEIVDLVDLDIERERNVVPQYLEARVIEQARDIVAPPGKIVVDAEHVAAFVEQPFA